MDIRRRVGSWVGRRIKQAGFLLLCAATLPAVADVGQATDWLSTTIQADGSYGPSTQLATPYQSTAEALRAFKAAQYFPAQGTTISLEYLSNPSYENTENLARRIIAAVDAGWDVSAWVAALESLPNRDGGYGEFAGYQSTNLDTAFALEAMVRAGHGSSDVTAYAMGFLLDNQRSDGAWADGNNEPSIYVTALAVQALTRLKQSYAGVSTALSRAQTFLLEQRHADGTWGDVFLTAEVLLALVPNVNDVAALDAGIAALQGQQGAEDSWGLDVYSTALAVRALSSYAARASGATDPAKASLVGTVIVAGSRAPLADATVSVSELPGKETNTAGDGGFTLVGLAPGSYTVVVGKEG